MANTTYHMRQSRLLEWYDYAKVWYIFDRRQSCRAGRILTNNEFELLSYDKEEDNVVSVWYNGVYIIVDNGYQVWSCTVPPLSITNKIDETRWLRWVESMRKDVECTFGILKGRWRILMTDDRVYGIDKVDEIWLTCCALHRLAVGHRWNIQPMEGRCSC